MSRVVDSGNTDMPRAQIDPQVSWGTDAQDAWKQYRPRTYQEVLIINFLRGKGLRVDRRGYLTRCFNKLYSYELLIAQRRRGGVWIRGGKMPSRATARHRNLVQRWAIRVCGRA